MVEKYGIGKKFITNEGYEVEIVEKIGYHKRRIKFENGYEVLVFSKAIEEGRIKNPYHLSVFGVGYFGVGEYNAKIDGKNTPEYLVWSGMLARCYNKKRQELQPTYKGGSL